MRPGEYWGAVELPYTDLKHHDASGKLYVTFERPDDTDPADPQPTTRVWISLGARGRSA